MSGAFDAIDRDHDGVITRAEWNAAMGAGTMPASQPAYGYAVRGVPTTPSQHSAMGSSMYGGSMYMDPRNMTAISSRVPQIRGASSSGRSRATTTPSAAVAFTRSPTSRTSPA